VIIIHPCARYFMGDIYCFSGLRFQLSIESFEDP
jgi:hypothetical protein